MKQFSIYSIFLIAFLMSCDNYSDSITSINEQNVSETAFNSDLPEGTPTLLFVDIEDKILKSLNLTNNNVTDLFSVPNGPSGVLAYDNQRKHIYYTDYDNDALIRNNLNGDNPEVVVTDAFDVRALSFDQEKNKLYYAEYSSNEVWAFDVNRDTTELAIEGPGLRSYGNIQDMEFVNGTIYSITPVQFKESVSSANIETNFVNRVLDYEEAGYGYGIGVDDINKFLFFNNVEEAGIFRSTTNGENISKVIDLNKVRVYGIVADGLANKLYFTTWGNELGISDLNGNNLTVIPIQGAARNLIKIYIEE